MKKELKISELLGKTLVSIENKDNRQLKFTTSEGEEFLMFDENSSYGNDSYADIEDIAGSLSDLLNNPILVAEERTSKAPSKDKEYSDWYTNCWTFYELATIKGSVTIRWYCSASPHYSAQVDFIRL